MTQHTQTPLAFKKSALAITLAALCGFGLAGCNDNDDDMVAAPAPDTQTPSTPAPTPMPTGDLIALTESGKIVSVNRSAPSTLVSSQNVTGLRANDSLVGIDYRPADGKLYGVGALGNIYTIDPTTGVATFKVALMADPSDTSAPFAGITGNPSLMSMDFNPVPDRLRVVGNDGQNLRINVDTGATFTDTQLSSSNSPVISSVAYTNSFAGAGTTRMFNIDVNEDLLYLQAPPNDGILASSVSLGVDAMGSSGFDIDGVNNMGYAALNVGNALQLYRIDVNATNTAASLIGDLPADLGDMRGLALKPAMNASAMVQGLSADGKQLVSFSPLTPTMTTAKAITDLLTNETIVGIDYRLRTPTDKSGVLYGLSSLGNLYTINTDTGAATGRLALTADPADMTAPFFTGLSGTAFAVDFNPVPDRMRVLSDDGQSLRINVDNGLTSADGSINGVANAKISAAAYTNSFQRPTGGTTLLLDLDQVGNQLLLQNPPNDGVVSVIGAFGAALTLSASNGMDIAGGDNGMVLATNGAGLYRINLMTGVATELAPKIGSTTTPALIDLAILLK